MARVDHQVGRQAGLRVALPHATARRLERCQKRSGRDPAFHALTAAMTDWAGGCVETHCPCIFQAPADGEHPALVFSDPKMPMFRGISCAWHGLAAARRIPL